MRRYPAYLSGAVLALLLLAAPSLLPSYYLDLLILALIWGVFAMSLDLITGFAGLPSFGHAAFFGVAAYTVGILDVKGWHDFAFTAPAGLFATVVIACIFGLFVMRSRGVYFLMITLALSMVLWGLASNWQALTGGHDGLSGVSRPALGPIPWDLTHSGSYYYFVLIFFAASVAVMRVIVRSAFGVALSGIRESDTRMSVLGYNVWLYKYLAFVVSALFAGIAGILFGYYNGFVHPSMLGIGTSAKVLIMTILGGPGTLLGPLSGAAIIVFLENLISAYSERWQMFLGAIYVIIVIFAPRGIYAPLAGAIRRVFRWDRS